MPLTAIAIRNAKPKELACKLFDGGGLFLFVTPSVTIGRIGAEQTE